MSKPKTPEAYLDAIVVEPERVDRFLTWKGANGLQPNRGWTYDAELGWVHADAVHDSDGVDGTQTFYRYEQDGARRVINEAAGACRIHTFGNSFTHCDQVNDNQTWQEYLAGHLQEPIRNYGVGGYGVYQAYRRLRRIACGGKPAPYVILNIWNDDHYRNLDAWRSIRFGRGSSCGFTLPHLRVDVARKECLECENLLPRPSDVYKLCDRDWVFSTFRDDPVLRLVLAAEQPNDAEPVPVTFGLPAPALDDDRASRLRDLHTQAALFASQYVLDQTQALLQQLGSKLLVVLSFGRGEILRHLEGKPAFDRTFQAYLQGQSYPVFDMRQAFAADFAHSQLGADAYLDRYYIGHHNPAGNFFAANALLPTLTTWLEPAPRPYDSLRSG